MRVTIAQLNPFIGDVNGNLEKIVSTLSQSKKDLPDLVIFPELFITGYPPRDLLEKSWFIKKIEKAIEKLLRISQEYPETGILFGAPQVTKKKTGKGLSNTALFVFQGKILDRQHKSLLPTYDVFDETRYFDPAPDIHITKFKDQILGISVCEDAWNDPDLWLRRFYPFDPLEILAKKGATMFINISASPFYIGKEEIRYRIIQHHAKKHQIPFIFVNQVGGNDELIFDGRSICVDKNGKPLVVFPAFYEYVQTIDTRHLGTLDLYHPQDKIESVHEALILGLRDYIKKCGFSKVVLGLSGGIDSAVVCCLAKEAIGSKNVLGVTMPAPYSSIGSIEDSRKLAKNLGIQFKIIPISLVYMACIQSLKEHLNIGEEIDVTLENIQARIRGNILMAFSNKFGYLVLSTGNKSELAVGYCTLYGDMSGGLAVISDVPKTMVYQLAHLINRKSKVIPEEIIKKAPSAELKPEQKDQDTLPAYNILDQILHYYVDEGYSLKNILDLNFAPEIVRWVIYAVNRNEYKRRQAAPGLKVTTKAFGMGRRMPIAAKYEEFEYLE
jgi:NAD+ synthase (glutamine-hydrolysing)